MHDLLVLGVKAIAGGTLVVAFSLLSEMLRPKSFAGVFGAAPSIALAALIVTVVSKGASAGAQQSSGMVFGALAMVAYCAAAVPCVDRFGAWRGSTLAIGVWSLVAGGSYYAVVGH